MLGFQQFPAEGCINILEQPPYSRDVIFIIQINRYLFGHSLMIARIEID